MATDLLGCVLDLELSGITCLIYWSGNKGFVMPNRFARQTGTPDANQADIVTALERIGCIVYDIDKPVDLLVEFRRLWIVLEVKTKKGILEDSQKRFFRNVKAPAFVVRNIEEAVAAVQTAWRRTQMST